MQKRQAFSKEFKLEAVRLLEVTDKPIADLAKELGVRRNQLYKWQEQLQIINRGQILVIANIRINWDLTQTRVFEIFFKFFHPS